MFGTNFYYQLTRKYIVLFGNIFNNISIVRRNSEDGAELERFKVPIIYGPKEKYYTRLRSDPDLQRETQITLPRMSFNITGMTYDPARAQNRLHRVAKGNTASRVASQYIGVPYDLSFELSIYAKNIDDCNQIWEQIVPYFAQDMAFSVNLIPEVGFTKDIPLIFEGMTEEIDYEGGFDSVRYVAKTLTFKMKVWYYGPVTTPKIIRKVTTNIFNDPSLVAGYIVRMNLDQHNNGTFKIDDIIYTGDNYSTARAYGQVLAWDAGSARLMIGGAQGTFQANNTIKALSTNAAARIASFDASPLKLAEIVIEPDPIDADPEDDYGYTTTITEFPDTL